MSSIKSTSSTVNNTNVIEVAALLGDSVVDVKHCMDPRSGKVSATTKAMFAVGASALVASAAMFGLSVATAASNKAGLETWTRTLHKPAHAYRANQGSAAVDFTAAAGGIIGLFGVTLGLARVRRERQSPSYRIGTAPGVSLAIEHTPSADYALVAPKGDDFVFNLAPGMTGEMTVDGTSTPLAQVAGTPSTTYAGAVELPIPASAKIRATSGKTTFVISSVARPVAQGNPLFAMEGRPFKYAAGSLAVHLAAVAFLALVPVEDSSVNLEIGSREDLSVKSNTTTNEDKLEVVKPETGADGAAGASDGGGGKMAFEDGKSGTEKGQQDRGALKIKKTSSEIELAREEAREYAATAGVLGATAAIQTSISSITGTANISSWTDQIDTHGAINGPDGDANGTGFGEHGGGKGGGCPLGVSSCGIVGSGAYNTIGDGHKVGKDYRIGSGGGGDDRVHTAAVPPVQPGPPIINGDLDKAIIKRRINAVKAKIGYCYESKLMQMGGDKDGSVMVTFFINGDGTVGTSTATGWNAGVASCVAGVVKDVSFPAPRGGGGVQVNYPFSFHQTGG